MGRHDDAQADAVRKIPEVPEKAWAESAEIPRPAAHIGDLATVLRCQYPAGAVAARSRQYHHDAALSARNQGRRRGSGQCTAKSADYAA